jgi:uncharacterized membrane protein YebE (DUF533 family)
LRDDLLEISIPASPPKAPGASISLKPAGMLISSKSSRKLFTRYGGKALIIGGGAAAGALLNSLRDDLLEISIPASPPKAPGASISLKPPPD